MAKFNEQKYRIIERTSNDAHAVYVIVSDEWRQLRSETQDLAIHQTSDPNRIARYETIGERVNEIEIRRVSGLRDIAILEALNPDSSREEFQNIGVSPETGKRYLQMRQKLARLEKERGEAEENYQYHNQIFSRCRDFLVEKNMLPSTETSMSMLS